MKLPPSLRSMLVALAVTASSLSGAYAADTYTLNGVTTAWPSGAIRPGYQAGGNEIIVDGVQSSGTNIDGVLSYSTTQPASDNSITVSNSSLGQIRGGVGSSGAAERNDVAVTDSTINGEIVGGKGGSTYNAGENSITLTNTTVTGKVYGGWNSDDKEHSVTNNTVTATNTTLKGSYLYGGYSQSKQAETIVSGNRVELTNTSYGNYVMGGEVSGPGTVTDNHVVITAAPEGSSGYVYGGSSSGGTVTNNTVTIEDSNLSGYLYGGRSSSSSAAATMADNAVVIRNSTFSTADKVSSYSPYKIYGAAIDASNSTGDTSSALNNSVTIEKSTVYAPIYGAYTKGLSTVSGNSVTVTDSTVTCGSNGIYGAYGEHSGDLTGNSVTVTNSTVTGTFAVIGALNMSGATASNNTITIDGSTVVGYIMGGYSQSSSQGTATGNTVILKSNCDLSQADIFGGYAKGDKVTGNKLLMEGFSGTVKSASYFDTIEQTGGNVTILNTGMKANTSISIKGTDESTPAVLTAGHSSGTLIVNGSSSVTMENAALEAEGTVTVTSTGSISLKNVSVTGSDFTLSGNGDASSRTLENVNIILVPGGTADLRNSTLKGSTSIGAISAFTMLASSDEAVNVLLDGSTVVLDSSNSTVSGSNGNYVIETTSLVGLNIEGSFTMDLSVLSEELEDFSSIEVQFTDSQLDAASNVTFAMDGVTYTPTLGEDGSSLTFGNAAPVPEPATATLSLLALAALAAHRRRK